MKKRSSTSLYGDRIRNAIATEQPWLKSEDLPESSYRALFVGNDLIDQLRTNSNQLVVGRRGTGKTHLFGAFRETIEAEEPSNILVSISILEVGQTPSITTGESVEFTTKRTAKALFEAFLNLFFTRFLDSVDRQLKRQQAALPKKEYSLLSSRVNDLLTTLLEAIEIGRPFPVHKTAIATHRRTRRSGNRAAAEATLGLGATGALPAFNLDFRIGRHADTESDTEVSVRSLLSIDLTQVRELISHVINTLHVRTLYILIDEWMELDKHTPSNIQAYFAQLLKIAFFNHRHIAVKIASVWHQTTLYDKEDLQRSKGIQLNHDIELAADLDTAFLRSEADAFNFAKTLLYRRLRFACPALSAFDHEGYIDDEFITELFDNKTNFKAFIAASHGIPRDMMALFQKCSLQFKRNFSEYCIDYETIAHVAREKFLIQKRKNIDPASSAIALLRELDKYVSATGRRLFIIRNEQVQNSRELKKLIDEEIVHQMPSAVTHHAIRDTHKAFLIDYGNFIDLSHAHSKELTDLMDESVLANFVTDFESVAGDYEINLSQWIAPQVTCSRCGQSFPLSHPVYARARVCPSCGQVPSGDVGKITQ